ncbi:unnamed protein product [Phytophthora lilii]|uniref:Unnamed protein product n=1 Tax=Phytophthora lilii TaxID=2077276 RepID=A0A9W6YFU3_9STRA|nr:unnamed protein product [Phytophthora lilii]
MVKLWCALVGAAESAAINNIPKAEEQILKTDIMSPNQTSQAIIAVEQLKEEKVPNMNQAADEGESLNGLKDAMATKRLNKITCDADELQLYVTKKGDAWHAYSHDTWSSIG